MKRIKAINGYTIYETTKRDERDGHAAGEYVIYFSSDIRDFGREYSYAEFEGVGTIEEAEALCNNNYAIAKELCEEETTAASFEEIEEKQKELDAAEANGNDARETITADEITNTDIIRPLAPCALVMFSRKTGKIETTLTGTGRALLKLWAIQNIKPGSDIFLFETERGLIISHIIGRRDNFPKIRDGVNRENIEDYAPGLLASLRT